MISYAFHTQILITLHCLGPDGSIFTCHHRPEWGSADKDPEEDLRFQILLHKHFPALKISVPL